MLACYNVARLWDKAFISVDVLEKNVTCITFGQPLLTIPYVQETIKKYTKFENTIHSIYDEEDVFPRLLCSTYCEYLQPDRETSTRALIGSNGNTSTVPSEVCHKSDYVSESI